MVSYAEKARRETNPAKRLRELQWNVSHGECCRDSAFDVGECLSSIFRTEVLAQWVVARSPWTTYHAALTSVPPVSQLIFGSNAA